MTRVKKSLFQLSACAALLLLAGLSGCADNSTAASSSSGLTAGGATTIYAVQNGNSILQYTLTAGTATLTPTATINMPTGVSAAAVAVDSAGLIYVGALTSTGVGEVLVYSAGSSGVATPLRTIVGGLYNTTTTFGSPQSIQVSSTGTLAILSTSSLGYTITTLPASSTGTVTPTTNVAGASTLISGADCITIDSAGKTYVTNFNGSTGAIYIFAANASGNAAPTTTITTGASAPYGIAVNSSGGIITILDSTTNSAAASLVTYASTATGAATPTSTVTGTSTGIFFGGGVRVDSVGNIYMINKNSASTVYSLLAFNGSATGNVTPPVDFTSTALAAPAAEIAVH